MERYGNETLKQRLYEAISAYENDYPNPVEFAYDIIDIGMGVLDDYIYDLQDD